MPLNNPIGVVLLCFAVGVLLAFPIPIVITLLVFIYSLIRLVWWLLTLPFGKSDRPTRITMRGTVKEAQGLITDYIFAHPDERIPEILAEISVGDHIPTGFVLNIVLIIYTVFMANNVLSPREVAAILTLAEVTVKYILGPLFGLGVALALTYALYIDFFH